jgi:hypothetical protein
VAVVWKKVLFDGDALGKLATLTGIDVTEASDFTVYTVSAGKSLIVTQLVIRVTSFTAGSKAINATISFGGNSTTYDDYIDSGTYVVAAANKAIIDKPIDPSSPIYAAGTAFKLKIEIPSDATTEEWAVDLFGYLI